MITDLLKTVISKLRGIPDTVTSELLNGRVNIEHARQNAELEAQLRAHERDVETSEERIVVSSQKVTVPETVVDIEDVELVVELVGEQSIAEPYGLVELADDIEVKVDIDDIPVLTDSEVLSEAKTIESVDEAEIELAVDVEALFDREMNAETDIAVEVEPTVKVQPAVEVKSVVECVSETETVQQEQIVTDVEDKPEGIDTTALLQTVIGSGSEEFKPFSRLVKPLTTLLGQAPTAGQVLDINPDDFRQMRGIGDARVKSLQALQALLDSQVKS